MTALLRSRITLVWAFLVGLTVMSFSVGDAFGLGEARASGVLIIVVALIKVRLVILDFMEIRHAPAWMRGVGEAWIILTAIVLSVLFVAPTG